MEDTMKVQAVTDIGRERVINQDYVFYSLTEVGSLPNLFIVADGMGGHKAGDMASRYTVETFVSIVKNSTVKNPISIINNAVTQVNKMLLDKAKESQDYEGMGTTLVVATIYDNVLEVANVGDSRLYVIGNDITQITRDHSLVEEMVSLGEIKREEARTHSQKNIITRAIGGYETVDAEMFSVDLKPKDMILMCSDGLSNMIEDSEILRIIKTSDDIESAAKKLVKIANDNGGRDNITVMIIQP
jgi:protein phosphatase